MAIDQDVIEIFPAQQPAEPEPKSGPARDIINTDNLPPSVLPEPNQDDRSNPHRSDDPPHDPNRQSPVSDVPPLPPSPMTR